jgi:hypothetical protein
MGRIDKKTKTTSKKDRDQNPTAMVLAIIMLTIMVLSIAGFAFMMNDGNGNTENNYDQDIPFQQFQTKEGVAFWGAILNGEQFIFPDIYGYDNQTTIAQIAVTIKNLSEVKVYQDNTVTSSDAMFIVEKTMKGIKKTYERVSQTDCSLPTLVLTQNSTKYDEKCLVLVLENGNELRNAEILSYFLIQ